MKYLKNLVLVCMVLLSLCSKKEEKKTALNLVTTKDTVSYLIGVDIARSLKDIKEDIVPDIIFQGIDDKLNNKERHFEPDQERIIMQAFGMQMEQKKYEKSEAEAKKNLEEANNFLKENGKKPGVITAESGLQYIVLKEGDGPKPTDPSRVKVHYEGSLLNGKVFDSSIKRGEPAVMNMNNLIEGWKEALKLMKVGSKYRAFIPPELAYGRRGIAHDIGPNMLLVFDIELLGIEGK